MPETLEQFQEYDDLVSRVYADQDFSHGGREVALALAWALHHPPAAGEKQSPWWRATGLLGRDSAYPQVHRIVQAAAEDLPWYDTRLVHWNQVSGVCEGPRVRPYKPRRPARPAAAETSFAHLDGTVRPYPGPEHAAVTVKPEQDDRVCGSHATTCVTEYDPVTGWETPHWFCTRHRERAAEVGRQLRAAVPEPPPPIPNRGGVLPRYFAANWSDIYGRVARDAYWPGPARGWEPPYHGVCRDDWPVPGKTPVPRRPRLAVVSA